MKIQKQAVKDPQPTMGLDGINATLGDTIVSDSKDKTLCAGFFHLNKTDKPLVYTYDYEEMKYVAEGEFFITDESGQKVHATVGDVSALIYSAVTCHPDDASRLPPPNVK